MPYEANVIEATSAPEPTLVQQTSKQPAETILHLLKGSDRFFRNQVVLQLQKLQGEPIELVDSVGSVYCGSKSDTPVATLRVSNPRFYRRVVFGGGVSAGESFLDGDWSTDDLPMLLRVFARNLSLAKRLNKSTGMLASLWQRLQTYGHRNTLVGSRRNIAAHYDLSNDFYRLWLDETMTYSSALWPEPNATLADASRNKYDRLCQQLEIGPDDHVLEIGTGWGGFALHAVQNYGCRVTTTTISKQQHDFAAERFAEAGLEDRITLLETDYRELTGEYDKVVSIEMIEAVGHEYLPTYFRTCNDRLKEGGKFGLQAILIPDQRYDAYRKSVDFMQKHIFPGGALPAIGSISKAIGDETSLVITDMLDFGFDYARTLSIWRDQFFAKIDDIRPLGFDDRFIRLWDYYLSYCMAGFLERRIGVSQIIFTKS